MLLLSKAFSQLLLPPGGLILLIIVGLFFWQKTWGKVLVICSIALLWMLSTTPVRNILTASLEYQYPPINIKNINTKNIVIVLLGGGVQEKSLDYQGKDTLSRPSTMRTVYAARLLGKTNLNIYTTGGSPLRENTASESTIMKQWLIDFGIDASRIHEEDQALTTWGNAVFTNQKLKQEGINTVVLVTSAWHMPRAVWCFEQQGLHVIAAPTDYLTAQPNYDLRSFLPRWNVLADSSDALHEYLGIAWYHIKYSK